jgi:CheY-like chemotaxis protein
MKKSDSIVVKRIFVKVFGFSDMERHALNTIFRLSEDRPLAYAPWTTLAPSAAQMVLIDGKSWEAAMEMANPAHDALTLIWVGDNAPARANLVMTRPLRWSAVVQQMDQLLATPDVPMVWDAGEEQDIDLDRLSEASAFYEADADADAEAHLVTAPLPLDSLESLVPLEPLVADPHRPHVLVIDADPEARFYWRAKLAAAGLAQVDGAATPAEALLCMQTRLYKLVLLDLDFPDLASWQLVKQIGRARPASEVLILTGNSLSPLDAARGWLAGAKGSLSKPFDPVKLNALLRTAM